MSTTTLTTVEQLLRMPRDGHRYELIQGELKEMSPTGNEHGMVLFRICGLLDAYLRRHKLGEGTGGDSGFILARDPDTVLCPDVAFIRRDRLAANPPTRAYWPGAPDLAIEITSPGDTKREVADKAKAWVHAGTQIVWIVDPDDRTVAVHRPGRRVETISEDGDMDGQDVLPGFRCRVADLFPPG